MLSLVTCNNSKFFFFKQKTAYERRISDWSSDVCSSDLVLAQIIQGKVEHARHLRNLTQHALSQFLIGDPFCPQLQARQRRSQVMADGCEHARAVVKQRADEDAHVIEGVRDTGDIEGPAAANDPTVAWGLTVGWGGRG